MLIGLCMDIAPSLLATFDSDQLMRSLCNVRIFCWAERFNAQLVKGASVVRGGRCKR